MVGVCGGSTRPPPARAASVEASSREAASREAASMEAASREAVSMEAASREAASRKEGERLIPEWGHGNGFGTRSKDSVGSRNCSIVNGLSQNCYGMC